VTDYRLKLPCPSSIPDYLSTLHVPVPFQMANHKKTRGNRPQSAPRTNSNGSRPRGLKPPRDSTSNGAAAVSDSDPSMAQSFLPFWYVSSSSRSARLF